MKSSHRFPLRRQIVWGMRFFTFLTSLAVGAALFILSCLLYTSDAADD